MTPLPLAAFRAMVADLLARYLVGPGAMSKLLDWLTERYAEALAQYDDASRALDEVVAPDETKPLAQRIRDEFHDFAMLLEHVETVYVHFSRNRISKANTLPREVIALAEEFAQDDIREGVKEALEPLDLTLIAQVLRRVAYDRSVSSGNSLSDTSEFNIGTDGAFRTTLAKLIEQIGHLDDLTSETA